MCFLFIGIFMKAGRRGFDSSVSFRRIFVVFGSGEIGRSEGI